MSWWLLTAHPFLHLSHICGPCINISYFFSFTFLLCLFSYVFIFCSQGFASSKSLWWELRSVSVKDSMCQCKWSSRVFAVGLFFFCFLQPSPDSRCATWFYVLVMSWTTNWNSGSSTKKELILKHTLNVLGTTKLIFGRQIAISNYKIYLLRSRLIWHSIYLML